MTNLIRSSSCSTRDDIMYSDIWYDDDDISVCGDGGHYLALARACPGVGSVSSLDGHEIEGEREDGLRVGIWANVADRKLASWRQVGGAVGVVSDEVSDEPL